MQHGPDADVEVVLRRQSQHVLGLYGEITFMPAGGFLARDPGALRAPHVDILRFDAQRAMLPIDGSLATWLQAALNVRRFVLARPGVCIRCIPAGARYAAVDVELVASTRPVGRAVARLDGVGIIERSELGGQFDAGVAPAGFWQHVHGASNRAAAMKNG